MHSSRALSLAAVLATAAIVGACRPRHPQPGADSTTVTVDTTPPADTASADTSVAIQDQQTAMPEVTAADTLPLASDSGARPRGLGLASGLPAGINSIDEDLAKQYRVTGAVQTADVRYTLPLLRRAEFVGLSRVLLLARRRQTANGDNNGPYSVARTKQAIDELAQIPADSIRRYVANGTLRGYVIMDDMACSTCWGHRGVVVTQQQADSVYRYAKAKLPAELPLGIRGNPSWVAAYPPLSEVLDFGWVQYLERLGDQRSKYDHEAAAARSLPHPLRVAYGINFYHFHRTGTPITAAELLPMGKLAIAYPGNCFFAGFTWWNGWRDAGRGEVWDTLLRRARGIAEPTACH